MDDSHIFAEQEAIINYVKQAILKISHCSTETEKEQRLYDLLAYLISSSNDIAQRHDFYEAAGRLYSAAYYLEQLHPLKAQEIYFQVINYYQAYTEHLIHKKNFSEAANVVLKIASIYKKKIKNQNEYLEQLKLGIELLKKSFKIIEGPLENLSNLKLREICHNHQNLALLYEKIKNWNLMLFEARTALKIAKKIPDYMVAANSFQYISRSISNLQNRTKGINILLEAIDYFAKEAENCEIKNEFIPLAQLYQIIKNLYDQMNNVERYEYFARKEAGVYLALANQGIRNRIKNEQIASYYRGAALCYQTLKGNSIDAASCFFLAAHYSKKAKKFYDAAISYEDAAKLLENLLKYQKAWDLYQQASSCAIRVNDYELAILNLINAEAVGTKINQDLQCLYHKMYKYLLKYAQIQHYKENYFISGTLFLEAAESLSKLPEIPIDKIKGILYACYCEYLSLFQKTDIKSYPSSTIYYIGVLVNFLDPIFSSMTEEEIKYLEDIKKKVEIFNEKTNKKKKKDEKDVRFLIGNHHINLSSLNKYENRNLNENQEKYEKSFFKLQSSQEIYEYLISHAPKKYIDLISTLRDFLHSLKPLRKSFFIKNRIVFPDHGIAEILKIHDLILKYPLLLKSSNSISLI
ncbi:MAG: hypothetical protein K9W44_08175 [Candidatus Lokiarchaeota archaeon]|nr:hypothetical protein [Candidatus Harpocratesius repetitus]